jgi:hypothetical protein
VLVGFVWCWCLAPFGIEASDFPFDFPGFAGPQLFFVPVDASPIFGFSAFGCGFEDEFGHVLILGTMHPSFAEISDHGGPILSDGTKVEHVATRIQGKNHIKFLYQN